MSAVVSERMPLRRRGAAGFGAPAPPAVPLKEVPLSIVHPSTPSGQICEQGQKHAAHVIMHPYCTDGGATVTWPGSNARRDRGCGKQARRMAARKRRLRRADQNFIRPKRRAAAARAGRLGGPCGQHNCSARAAPPVAGGRRRRSPVASHTMAPTLGYSSSDSPPRGEGQGRRVAVGTIYRPAPRCRGACSISPAGCNPRGP